LTAIHLQAIEEFSKTKSLSGSSAKSATNRIEIQESRFRFWVPPAVLMGNMPGQSIPPAPAIGATIIETATLADQFIEILRNKAQVMRLGAADYP